MLTKTATRARIAGVKKQGDFFKLNREFAPGRLSHGDESCVGKRKLARPFKRHTPIHLVMKSDLAKGRLNLLSAPNRLAVERIFSEQARRFGVKIHSSQNVGNHIHAVVSCGVRENFHHFLRAVAGLIASAVLPKGRGKFWSKPPFTRLLNGRRDFAIVRNYIEKNRVEAESGKDARLEIEEREFIARKKRRRELARTRRADKIPGARNLVEQD